MSLVTSALSRTVPQLLRTAGRQRLSILIYHRVLDSYDPLRPDEPCVQQFRQQMRLLRRHFNPLPLLEAVDRLQAQDLPERAVCVTFDDGYADNERLAMPVLQEEGVPATVFISTGFLNGGRMFNDTVIETLRNYSAGDLDLRDIDLGVYPVATNEQRLRAVADILSGIKRREPGARQVAVERIEALAQADSKPLMMTDEQVRALAAAGLGIGAHTRHHPILASVDDALALEEISVSRSYLEDLLQVEVNAFAYPNGRPGEDYTAVHARQVKELGFRTAVSTHWGVAVRDSDPFQLPRFTPWDRTPLRFCLRLLVNYRRLDPLVAAG